MKTSLTKLKISLLFSLSLGAGLVFARPVAQVIEVKGQVFSVSPDGSTKTLKANDHIEEKTEIMVGEDGNITLNDYYDSTYHMIEGSHIKFFNKSVQLKKGKAWIQALNSRHPLVLTTANGHVDYWKGEFITTFSQANGKTQVLVVNGEVEVSNVLDKNMKYTLAAGTFTMIDPETENGIPRAPTKVGLDSLSSAMAEFKTLPMKLQENSPTTSENAERSIASVEVEKAAPLKGQIIFMTNGKVGQRHPASATTGAHSYFKKKMKTKNVQLTSAPIQFYGVTEPILIKPKDSPRTPASILKSPVEAPKKIATEVKMDDEFTNSLRLNQGSQPKHTKELENLIQDLQSY